MTNLVLIESPFAHPHPQGRILHAAYLELCLHDSIYRGETPIATHKLYTICLDDTNVVERRLGMRRALDILPHVSLVAVYVDLGISPGMQEGIVLALEQSKPIMYRTIFNHPNPSNF